MEPPALISAHFDSDARIAIVDVLGTMMGAREALSWLCDRLDRMGCSKGQLGGFEIVMAEVLNNIVEHAYAGTTGKIGIEVQRKSSGIRVCVVDSGLPLPNGRPPTTSLPKDYSEHKDLPEGGFGWHLIGALTKGLKYSRSAGKNVLIFETIPLES